MLQLVCWFVDWPIQNGDFPYVAMLVYQKVPSGNLT